MHPKCFRTVNRLDTPMWTCRQRQNPYMRRMSSGCGISDGQDGGHEIDHALRGGHVTLPWAGVDPVAEHVRAAGRGQPAARPIVTAVRPDTGRADPARARPGPGAGGRSPAPAAPCTPTTTTAYALLAEAPDLPAIDR